MRNLFHIISVACFLLYSLSAHAITDISIKAERVEHPQGDAQNVALHINLNKRMPSLDLTSALKRPAEKSWTEFSLYCDQLKNIQSGELQCPRGLLKNTYLHLPFSLEIKHLLDKRSPNIDATIKLNNASFSDEAGMHAAEKLTANLAILLKQVKQSWQWQAALDWQSGEMFWQPIYIASGGHSLTAKGTLTDNEINIENAKLMIKNVGGATANGQVRLNDFKLLALNVDVASLDLSSAYPLLLKPFLGKTALNNVEVAGRAALTLAINETELKSFDLRLNDVDIADQRHKFAFYKLNANMPWGYDTPRDMSLSYASGELLNLPLGKANMQAVVNRFSLTSPNIRLPVLDGALRLSDVSAARIGGQWYWHLSAMLEPVSMVDFSAKLNLPSMQGKASADIPLVTYSNGMLTTDGSVVLNVFSGTATVTQLTMQTPLGITPKLNADIELRQLDLGDLTRTFSFGAIEGKLDGDIDDLELQNWKPVRFDAMLQSSPGRYPKKISQRAVENISALGGGGAAAAVQRSFLRFFKQFNYGKMGLSCRLRHDICEMGGIESTSHGYVIVKGSGIPSITVMGYNQTVGWSELLARIKRVTDGNSKAIIN